MLDKVKFPHLAAYLQKQVGEIKSRNPRVSIRSLSAKAGISPGRMTDLINGRRALSEYYAEKLVHALKLEGDAKDELYGLISATSRKELRRRVLSEQELSVLTGWENYAILNVLKIKGFIATPESIAERLAIPVDRAQMLLETLEGLKLVKNSSAGYQRQVDALTTSWDIPSEALREAHSQIIRKSIDVLHQTTPDQRHYTSLTMPIDLEKLESAKEMILEFRKKMNRHFETGKTSEVYNLSIQLFPLTSLKD
jgi:hypothetical protein